MRKEVEYSYYEGKLSDVDPILTRSIAQYKRYYSHIKIGITNNPEKRFSQHLRNIEWERMVVKYHTRSINRIRKIEYILVDKFWDYNENQVAGGNMPETTKDYYLYILLRN
jgi:hypothetical protein